MKSLVTTFLLALVVAVRAEDTNRTMLPMDPDREGWSLVPELSDEFNGDAVDRSKWNTTPWHEKTATLVAQNVFLTNGLLHIRMAYHPQTNSGVNLFYTTGKLRSVKQINYGYFEARIKGCSVYPGVCPAFWVLGTTNTGKVRYSEVDFVEILQGKLHEVDCNLHTQITNEEGKVIWIRPSQDPQLCKHSWNAPWDPRDDFHVYGCDVESNSITWYVDGAKVAEAENRYWHLPMNVLFSLELRPPYVRYEEDGTKSVVADKSTANGFPTEMLVDYVRVWTKSTTQRP